MTNESDKQWFQNLPNFDADIFLEITGVEINSKKSELLKKANELLQKAQELQAEAEEL